MDQFLEDTQITTGFPNFGVLNLVHTIMNSLEVSLFSYR